jgi:hypothetical protein
MARMTKLWLFQNRLSGPLPASWAAWQVVRDISLNDNQLTGTIPAAWGQLGTSLRDLYLQNNTALSGCLPDGLARFQGRPEVCADTRLKCSACGAGGGRRRRRRA